MVNERQKMTQLASTVSPDGKKWVRLRSLLATLEALLTTLDIPLRIFTHLCKVFMNNCAFLLKINGKFSKLQKIALEIVDFAQKYRKRA